MCFFFIVRINNSKPSFHRLRDSPNRLLYYKSPSSTFHNIPTRVWIPRATMMMMLMMMTNESKVSLAHICQSDGRLIGRQRRSRGLSRRRRNRRRRFSGSRSGDGRSSCRGCSGCASCRRHAAGSRHRLEQILDFRGAADEVVVPKLELRVFD